MFGNGECGIILAHFFYSPPKEEERALSTGCLHDHEEGSLPGMLVVVGGGNR